MPYVFLSLENHKVDGLYHLVSLDMIKPGELKLDGPILWVDYVLLKRGLACDIVFEASGVLRQLAVIRPRPL